MNTGIETHGRSSGTLARGRLCIALAAALWSMSGVVTKGPALASLDGLSIALGRSLFAGLALLPFVPFREWRVTPALVMLAIVFGGTVGTFLASLRVTTAANAIFLQCSAAAWTAIFTARLLREPLGRRTWLGIGCAVPGVLAIALFGHGNSAEEWWGVVLGLISGLGYAGVTVMMRQLRGLDPAWLCAAMNLGGAATLAAWLVLTQGRLPAFTGRQLIVLAGFGTVQLALPYTLFARGLRSIPAPEAGLITLIEPILNPIWVFLAHHEKPRAATLVGGCFLMMAVAVRYLPLPRLRPRSRPRP